ncbi:hypothetical protein [Thermopolyspora flexuosa]|nr:hypothetical protein [Thermopolyspora flexuosa]
MKTTGPLVTTSADRERRDESDEGEEAFDIRRMSAKMRHVRMMRTRAVADLTAATLCLPASITACAADEKVDTAPLPTVAAPPYVCGHLPRQAVKRMTGLTHLVARGSFDLNAVGGHGSGWCIVSEPGGERLPVLEVSLLTDFAARSTEEEVRLGAKRLPPIVTGGDGYSATKRSGGDVVGALAVLTRGRSTLIVSLDKRLEGRDPEADTVALMRLVAPRLLGRAVPSPSGPTPP